MRLFRICFVAAAARTCSIGERVGARRRRSGARASGSFGPGEASSAVLDGRECSVENSQTFHWEKLAEHGGCAGSARLARSCGDELPGSVPADRRFSVLRILRHVLRFSNSQKVNGIEILWEILETTDEK